jgi:hypothetical protein
VGKNPILSVTTGQKLFSKVNCWLLEEANHFSRLIICTDTKQEKMSGFFFSSINSLFGPDLGVKDFFS